VFQIAGEPRLALFQKPRPNGSWEKKKQPLLFDMHYKIRSLRTLFEGVTNHVEQHLTSRGHLVGEQ
jgi:hypothetical protein